MNQSEQQVIDESILLEDESLLLSEMNRYVQDENGTCRSVSDVTRRSAGGADKDPHGAAERVLLTQLLLQNKSYTRFSKRIFFCFVYNF